MVLSNEVVRGYLKKVPSSGQGATGIGMSDTDISFSSCLCFAQIHSRSSCFKLSSCGKSNLLRINSCSCTDPIRWLRCHLRNCSSMLLLHSEPFVNVNVVSLHNDSPLVSNKHLFSNLEASRTSPQDYGLL